jgi:hypothetical protein
MIAPLIEARQYLINEVIEGGIMLNVDLTTRHLKNFTKNIFIKPTGA